MAAASMKRAGKVSDMAARAMQTGPSSSGWRMRSRKMRGNSGNSSREQRPIVSKRNLARPRDRAAADQTCVGDGVVRRAERSQPDESGVRIEHTSNTVDLGGLQRFFESKGRQDRRHALRQHGFSRSWRPDHQNVVTTSAGDFKGPLGGLLAANVFEIHREVLRLAEQLIGVDLQAGDAVAGVNEMNDFQQ